MVSVCIATYNGENYIAQQLNSILCQISADDEVIISDDGSTDNTIAVINSIADPRIKVINGGFHNIIRNFENALLQAKGNYIFLSDQDDVWLQGKYDCCLDWLKKVDLVCTNSTVVDENLNVIIPSFFEYYHSGKGIIKNIINSTYFGACMAFNRKIYNAAIPFPPKTKIGHDIWIGLVANAIGKVQFINTPYLLYRRHDSTFTNISTNLLSRSKRSIFAKIWSRIVTLYTISIFKLKYMYRKA